MYIEEVDNRFTDIKKLFKQGNNGIYYMKVDINIDRKLKKINCKLANYKDKLLKFYRGHHIYIVYTGDFEAVLPIESVTYENLLQFKEILESYEEVSVSIQDYILCNCKDIRFLEDFK